MQRLLDPVIAEGVQAVWAGDNQGRLKPLKEWIDAKLGEDIEYFQLRLCLRCMVSRKDEGTEIHLKTTQIDPLGFLPVIQR